MRALSVLSQITSQLGGGGGAAGAAAAAAGGGSARRGAAAAAPQPQAAQRGASAAAAAPGQQRSGQQPSGQSSEQHGVPPEAVAGFMAAVHRRVAEQMAARGMPPMPNPGASGFRVEIAMPIFGGGMPGAGPAGGWPFPFNQQPPPGGAGGAGGASA